MRAIRVHETGGPEALVIDEIDTPEPGPGQVLVQVEAAGVNFIDVYHRTGLYPAPLPLPLGLEGAGVVVAWGPGVDGDALGPGTRVAWTRVPGSYATHVVAPADQLVRVPDAVGTREAAAAMLQGLTAHYLTQSTYPLEAGDTCLIHAAAGGVGLLLCQLARRAGARAIGTTSTEAKAERARAAGADEVILYTRTAVPPEVARLTGGRGVQVVYDSVGKDTFAASLDCLTPRGMLVLYGQSSGMVPPFDPTVLNQKGSLFLTRPSLNHYVATRDELLARAADVLGWVADGSLSLTIDHVFPLDKARVAHELLESRATAGKLLLIP